MILSRLIATLKLNGAQYWPADFLVEVETTRAIHQRHVQINSINITSTIPKVKEEK
jgi:hypothetical protein